MLNLTSSQLRQAADLKEKIEALNTELAGLLGGEIPIPVHAPEATETAKPTKRTMSPAHKAKIRAAQALRWAKYNAGKGQPRQPVKSGKGTRGKPVEGVTGMILKKISDEEIKAFIGGGKGQGDLVKKYGQFIPKRLADMKKAGLVSVRRDGLKKIWNVV